MEQWHLEKGNSFHQLGSSQKTVKLEEVPGQGCLLCIPVYSSSLLIKAENDGCNRNTNLKESIISTVTLKVPISVSEMSQILNDRFN